MNEFDEPVVPASYATAAPDDDSDDKWAWSSCSNED
jgi:hypothetical protein